MLTYARANCPGPLKGAIALCNDLRVTDYAKNKRTRTKTVCADVHFFRSRIGMEVTTHELLHATIAWARRVNFPFSRLNDDSVNDDEERFCHAHGKLCCQFIRKAYEAGLYDQRSTVSTKGTR
jgi:hypothetical protein